MVNQLAGIKTTLLPNALGIFVQQARIFVVSAFADTTTTGIEAVSGFLLQALEESEAVHFWHRQIADDEVRLAVADGEDPLCAVGGFINPITLVTFNKRRIKRRSVGLLSTIKIEVTCSSSLRIAASKPSWRLGTACLFSVFCSCRSRTYWSPKMWLSAVKVCPEQLTTTDSVRGNRAVGQHLLHPSEGHRCRGFYREARFAGEPTHRFKGRAVINRHHRAAVTQNRFAQNDIAMTGVARRQHGDERLRDDWRSLSAYWLGRPSPSAHSPPLG